MTSNIDSLPAAIHWLYGLAPSDFVAARKRLVSDLRARGSREVATEVASLRRPTVLAAELNRVLRSAGAGVESMLEAARVLRAGQQAALSGEPVDLGRLRQEHRAASSAVADQAERDQAEIQAVLEAASLDEGLHQALRAASFAVEPRPQTGFDLLAAQSDATVSSLSEARARKRAAAHPPEPALVPDPEADSGDDEPETSHEVGTAAAAAAELAGDPIGDNEPSPAHRATEQATKAGNKGVDVEGASKTHELAVRRVEAAAKTAAKARERVDAAEARLAAARGHLAEATTRLEAANSAEERARARLAEAQQVQGSASERRHTD